MLILAQTVVALDLYLAYLRAAFNTCYYCAVVTDHVEELQRKCVKHVRKPLSKSLLQEIKAAEAQKAETEPQAEGENVDERKEKDKESPVKEKTENRDWKRNGMITFLQLACSNLMPECLQMNVGWIGWIPRLLFSSTATQLIPEIILVKATTST